ncbi:MAG: hypothetical protein K6F14_06855 [Clostridiales bacterium]|nr:hypothetical protein [Clostridiales bacterium]
MKKLICVLLSIMIIALACSCGKKNDTTDTGTNSDKQGACAFTDLVKTEEGISFCLPANRDGNLFTDMGANCCVMYDHYSYRTAAYEEYDNDGPIEKKTVGQFTYDYQKFHYLGADNWIIYVIRIAFTESRNQMAHNYYRILYNVYAKDYDDSQVEKFMSTIQFDDYVINYN